MSNLTQKLLCGSLLIAPAIAAIASPVGLGTTRIQTLENGWYGEGMVLTMDQSTGGCGQSNQYIVRMDHPAYKQMVAAALIAYAQQKPINLIVDSGNCSSGRTVILDIVLVA